MRNLHSIFDIVIPNNAPFENDALNRKPFAESILNVIKLFNGGVVIALNGAWGTGKTTFIKMFNKWLQTPEQQNKFCTVTINAWEHEYFNDPTLAILSCVRSLLPEKNEEFVEATSKIEVIKQTLPSLGKNGLKNLISKFSLGFISSENLTEVESKIKEINETNYLYKSSSIDEYTKEIEGFRLFKESISDYFNYLSDVTQNPIIIFIDELDRCSPNYAVSLLERIKHLFSTENTVFILSIDKEQFCHSICGYYGSENISSEEYLRRFIDIEISMPSNNNDKFSKNTLDKLTLLENYFLRGTYWNTLSDALKLVTSYRNLTLRQIEKLLILSALAFQKARADSISFFISIPLAYIKCFEPSAFDRIYKKEMKMPEFHDFIAPIYLSGAETRKDYFAAFLYLYQDYCSMCGQPKEGFRCYDNEFKYLFEDDLNQQILDFALHTQKRYSLENVIGAFNIFHDLIN